MIWLKYGLNKVVNSFLNTLFWKLRSASEQLIPM